MRADTFGVLYRAHAPSVFRRARNLLGSDADAHDVVSDVFLSLYERPAQFQGRSRLSTFLYSMTTNLCLNRLRRQRQRAELHEKVVHFSKSTPPPSPDHVVQLRKLLETVPEALAQVAVYYHLDELTQDEIAEILGCSRRHVGNLLARLHDWVANEESA